MTPEQAWTEYVVRFYQWALTDARDEIVSGAPLLRELKSAGTKFFMPYDGMLSFDEELALSRALVTRTHGAARHVLGITPTRDEQRLLDWSDRVARRSIQEERQAFAGYITQDLPSANPAEVVETVVTELERVTRARFRFDSKLQAHAVGMGAGTWKVQTEVELERNHRFVRYSHSTLPKLRKNYYPINSGDLSQHYTHLLRWQGLTMSDIMIPAWFATDSERIAILVGKCVERFMSGIFQIIDGLKFD